MLVGILSDTHDQTERTRAAIEDLTRQGARAFFHCGDLTGPAIVSLFPEGSYFTLGNNDRDIRSIRKMVEERGSRLFNPGGEVRLAGKRIALTHGHLKTEKKRLLESGPDYLLLGHSHRKGSNQIGKTRVINPGALHRAPTWTVALLDLENDEVRFLTLPKPA